MEKLETYVTLCGVVFIFAILGLTFAILSVQCCSFSYCLMTPFKALPKSKQVPN